MESQNPYPTKHFLFGKTIKNIFFLLPLLLFFACTKNSSDTIVLLGTESYIDDILDVIPDSLRIAFDTHFGKIPQGYVPPNIEGKFVIAPKHRCYSNVTYWPLNVVERNMNLHLSNQHNSVVEIMLSEDIETFTDTVFVMGYDNMFTIYYQETKILPVNENEISIRRGVIIKGEMCDEGIKNLYFANIIMDVQGDYGNTVTTHGQFYIYKDGDGLARKEDGK